MGILAPQADERVKAVQIDEDTLSVELMDGRTISVPLAWFPRLLNATQEQREQWQICGGGYVAYTGKKSMRISAPKGCCAERPRLAISQSH
jgi:hypothetical protein